MAEIPCIRCKTPSRDSRENILRVPWAPGLRTVKDFKRHLAIVCPEIVGEKNNVENNHDAEDDLPALLTQEGLLVSSQRPTHAQREGEISNLAVLYFGKMLKDSDVLARMRGFCQNLDSEFLVCVRRGRSCRRRSEFLSDSWGGSGPLSDADLALAMILQGHHDRAGSASGGGGGGYGGADRRMGLMDNIWRSLGLREDPLRRHSAFADTERHSEMHQSMTQPMHEALPHSGMPHGSVVGAQRDSAPSRVVDGAGHPIVSGQHEHMFRYLGNGHPRVMMRRGEMQYTGHNSCPEVTGIFGMNRVGRYQEENEEYYYDSCDEEEVDAEEPEEEDIEEEDGEGGVSWTFCARCGADAPEWQCSLCRQAAYCSQECQHTHWKAHKETCKRNRGLVALS